MCNNDCLKEPISSAVEWPRYNKPHRANLGTAVDYCQSVTIPHSSNLGNNNDCAETRESDAQNMRT
jgi:hypothetical protein